MIALTLAAVLAVAPVATKEELEVELSDTLRERPSGLWFIPAGLMLGGGVVSTITGLLSGVHCGLFSGCYSAGPLDWGWASIGAGLAGIVGGTVMMIVLRALRLEPNRRIDALEARLKRIEERERREREAEEQAQIARLEPHVQAELIRLEDERPTYGPLITFMSLASGGLVTAIYGGAMYFGGNGSDAHLIMLIAGGLVAAGFGGASAYQAAKDRPKRIELDDQIEHLKESPPAPPPFASRLPPAPVYLGWSWPL